MTRALATLTAILISSTPTWAGDTQIDPQPKQSVLLEDAAEDGWGAELGLTLWTVNMEGVLGAGGLVAPIDLSFGDILDNIDFAIMGTADIRKRDSKIGFMFEGSYIKLGPSIDDAPLPFFSIDGIQIEQVMASAAVYYRIAEWDQGYFDVFGGARYMYMSNGLELSTNSAAVSSASRSISADVTSEISRRAADAVASAKPVIISELQRAARRAIISGIIDGSIDPEKINPATIALARAIVAEQAAAAGSAARRKASKKVEKLERKLAREIEKKITDAIPDSVNESADWLDPMVGVRARHYLNDRIYLAALADIGGFGAGSELSWNAGLGVGVELKENLALEFAYRYMSIDYDDDILVDVAMSGLFLGAKLKF
ncbi:MAG: hypothetical protein ACR2RV_27540 [Verrucomicrobiales bacterium]